MKVGEVRTQLRPRAELVRDGLTSRQITRAISSGRLRRVDHGWYVEQREWDAAFSEGRHLFRVVAAHERQRDTDAVFILVSAAVMHELPLYLLEPRRVHIGGSHTNGRVQKNAPTLARHEVAVHEDDVVVIDGIRCTGLARTVADLIRSASIEAGLAAMDAALRRIAWNENRHSYDIDAAEAFRSDVAARLPRGGRGVRLARRVCELGDGRAQLPGESVSRLRLLAIGFASPQLQVPVPAPHGGDYYVDFGLDDANAWGEFDGAGKYVDPELRGAGVDIEDTVLAEKMREDWIRGTTQRPVVRWGSAHIRTAGALAERLASFHVFPGPRGLAVGFSNPHSSPEPTSSVRP
ncbi:hypothetical protein AAIB33_00125 [Microbacterium sp. AZCO]|uniref:hypothetical protein n=1 Tax=Microbacterium sp. AZCO TaxID=3142976 RepID=UPI0031F4321E